MRVLLGTDAGDTFVFPGFSAHDELGELVKAGLSPAQALRAGTADAAEFLGRAADFGAVEAGKVADLVVLDGDPLESVANARRIRAVVLGGRWLDRAALDALLRGAEAAARRPGLHEPAPSPGPRGRPKPDPSPPTGVLPAQRAPPPPSEVRRRSRELTRASIGFPSRNLTKG